MRLARLGLPGSEHPVVEDQGEVYSLARLTSDIDGAFLAADGIERVEAALREGSLDPVEGWQSLRRGAPLSRPMAVICIGMNYAAHAAESGSPPPKNPIVFFKHPNTVVGPDDDVLLPPGSAAVDWEVELAVVVGRRARYLSSPDEARGYIAGYAVSNDVSERQYQLNESGGQWSKGKSCETFNPLGPFLVPASDIDPGSLSLGSWVNGEVRQNSNTKDLIFNVDTLVWHLSQYMVLEPGDVINTGTPEGVALSGRFPYLVSGDVLELSIEGLGRQRQRVRNAHR